MADAIAFASATRLARMIARRKIGARELLELYLARTRALNPALNAVVVLNAAPARRRADELDKLTTSRGARLGPLHGVPMTVKESYDVKGLPTTCGFPVRPSCSPRPRHAANSKPTRPSTLSRGDDRGGAGGIAGRGGTPCPWRRMSGCGPSPGIC